MNSRQISKNLCRLVPHNLPMVTFSLSFGLRQCHQHLKPKLFQFPSSGSHLDVGVPSINRCPPAGRPSFALRIFSLSKIACMQHPKGDYGVEDL